MRVEGKRIDDNVQSSLALSIRLNGNIACAVPNSKAHTALLQMEEKGWVRIVYATAKQVCAKGVVEFALD